MLIRALAKKFPQSLGMEAQLEQSWLHARKRHYVSQDPSIDLEAYWHRMLIDYPDHPVAKEGHRKNCIPLAIHGDEGNANASAVLASLVF